MFLSYKLRYSVYAMNGAWILCCVRYNTLGMYISFFKDTYGDMEILYMHDFIPSLGTSLYIIICI